MSIFVDNEYEYNARLKIIEAQQKAAQYLANERLARNRQQADEFHAMNRAQMPDVIDIEAREVPGTTAAQIKRASKKARNVRRHRGRA